MLESDLSEPVSNWMRDAGFLPYAEVPYPWGAHAVDLVGRREDELLAVELKRGLSEKVIHQAYRCNFFSARCYAAVGTKPKASGVERCRKYSLGLLSVVGESVNVILEPKDSEWVRASYVRKVHVTLNRMIPGGLGGVPCMKGVGPAQECYEHVSAYRARHPYATWRQIFESVPSHYADYKSMCGAMRMVEGKRLTERSAPLLIPSAKATPSQNEVAAN